MHIEPYPTSARAASVLFVLLLANTLNVADRVLLGILQEPIRHQFHLTDFRLGLLGGPAFAILYAILGIPIAQLAERSNRQRIVTVALAVFSVMTAACGMAVSYPQLLAARIGVSVGEAGTSPPSISLISDYFPPGKRARAMAIYSIGAPAGALSATIAGAAITQHYGWRSSFLAFGAAGLVVSALLLLTVSETRSRGSATPRIGFAATICVMARRRSFIDILLATAFGGFAANFLAQYLVSFLIRVHDLPLSDASALAGLSLGVCGVIGAVGGGYAADCIARKRPAARTNVCVAGMIAASICFAIAFWSSLQVAIPLMLIAAGCLNVFVGVSYAAVSAVVPSGMRATAIALHTLAGNMFGYALGPPILGKISDLVAARAMHAGGADPAFCLSNMASPICKHATGEGIRWAMTVAALILIASAWHFWRASQHMVHDLAEQPSGG